METKSFGRAIGQEEETEVIMTGESAAEAYKKLLEMAENAANAKKTNFEAITESPEKLAEFIVRDRKECHNAICAEICTGCDEDKVLEWLMEKCNE